MSTLILKRKIKEWAEKEKRQCEEKHTKMMNEDFLSAEMCEDFPEYWLGKPCIKEWRDE